LTVLPILISLPARPPTPPLFPYTTLFRSCPCRPRTSSPARSAERPSPRNVGGPGRSTRPGPPRRTPPGTRTQNLRIKSPLLCQLSEEHTSELQSRENLVCRLLLEKKKYSI